MSSPAATSLGPPKDRDAAVASGVDHIDTIDFYGPHMNQIIMRALQCMAKHGPASSGDARRRSELVRLSGRRSSPTEQRNPLREAWHKRGTASAATQSEAEISASQRTGNPSLPSLRVRPAGLRSPLPPDHPHRPRQPRNASEPLHYLLGARPDARSGLSNACGDLARWRHNEGKMAFFGAPRDLGKFPPGRVWLRVRNLCLRRSPPPTGPIQLGLSLAPKCRRHPDSTRQMAVRTPTPRS
jgi:hypothetical protein